jgi:hypothetical protein
MSSKPSNYTTSMRRTGWELDNVIEQVRGEAE